MPALTTVKLSNKQKVLKSVGVDNLLDPELTCKNLREQNEGRGRLLSMRAPSRSDRKGISLITGKENVDQENLNSRGNKDMANRSNVSRASNRTERFMDESYKRTASRREERKRLI